MRPYSANNRDLATKNGDKISIFDDEQPLPVLYPPNAVYICSFLFSPMFGAILLAMNFSRTASKRGVWQVLTFGIVYSVAMVFISQTFLKNQSYSSFMINLGGALIIKYLFWNTYIGKDAAYYKRSVIIPVLIGILIMGGFLLLAIFVAK